MVDQCGSVQTPDEVKVVILVNVFVVENLARGVDLWNEFSDILWVCQPVLTTSEEGCWNTQCAQVVGGRVKLCVCVCV